MKNIIERGMKMGFEEWWEQRGQYLPKIHLNITYSTAAKELMKETWQANINHCQEILTKKWHSDDLITIEQVIDEIGKEDL